MSLNVISEVPNIWNKPNHLVVILSKKGTDTSCGDRGWHEGLRINPGIHGGRITWADFYVYMIMKELNQACMKLKHCNQTPPTSTLGRGKRSCMTTFGRSERRDALGMMITSSSKLGSCIYTDWLILLQEGLFLCIQSREVAACM